MYSVLLVDDEFYVRELLKKLVRWEDFGFEVVAEAQDGEEAVALINSIRLNVIFADIEMPFVNGLELAEYLHAHYPDLLTAFLTGYDSFEYAQAAVRYGVQNYLLKPVVKEELIDTLQDMRKKLDGRQQAEKEFFIGESAVALLREELCAMIRRKDSEEIAIFIREKLNHAKNESVNSHDAILDIMIAGLEDYCHKKNIPLDCAGARESDESFIEIFVKAVCDGEDRQNRYNQLIASVKEHIKKHYSNPDLSLKSIASDHFVNPSYLSRVFSQETGESVSGYIRELRLTHAMRLLKSGASSIDLIADKTGYRNAGYFSKCFKKKYGLVPSDYAKLGNQGDA